MEYINTVTGPLPSGELGFCQCHEHLWITRGQSALVNPDICIDDAVKSRQELALYREAGGRAIVDAQPVGCGRDAGQLELLSRESGVHIIASTGFHRAIYYPDGHWLFSCDVDWLTRLFIEELEHGMYGSCDNALPSNKTDIRAGQIKAALDPGDLSGHDEKVFCAASEAATVTGAPLMVHIQEGSNPLRLSDFLYRRNVPLDRVIFCHMDRSLPDPALHRELCARGVSLEYDTVARPNYHDDNREAEMVLELLQGGWEANLLMSLDVTRARLVSYGGQVGLCYILNTFLPLLREHGVGEGQIDSIFRANPARLYAQPGPR